jgi:hypothetical protein
LPLDQSLKVIPLENPKGWPSEELPTHLHRLFSNNRVMKTHTSCVKAKVEEEIKKKYGNGRSWTYTKTAGFLQFVLSLKKGK